MRGVILLLMIGIAAPAVAAGSDKPAPKTSRTPTSVAGIRTVFIPSPQSPLCAIRLVFQIGSVDDPAGQEGVASLTADMLGRGGSKTRNSAVSCRSTPKHRIVTFTVRTDHESARGRSRRRAGTRRAQRSEHAARR